MFWVTNYTLWLTMNWTVSMCPFSAPSVGITVLREDEGQVGTDWLLLSINSQSSTSTTTRPVPKGTAEKTDSIFYITWFIYPFPTPSQVSLPSRFLPRCVRAPPRVGGRFNITTTRPVPKGAAEGTGPLCFCFMVALFECVER